MYRRTFAKISALGAFGALAGCTATQGHGRPPGNQSDGDGSGPSSNAPPCVTEATRVSPRDFHEENYEITHTYRRNEAIRVLLRDPKVNNIASGWIGSFEAYEQLTNKLDAVSIRAVRTTPLPERS